MTEEIVAEAIRLLIRGGAPLWAMVCLALGVAAAVVVGRRISSLPRDPPPPPEPPTEVITEKDPSKVDWDGEDYRAG